jgi:hypothetical protein
VLLVVSLGKRRQFRLATQFDVQLDETRTTNAQGSQINMIRDTVTSLLFALKIEIILLVVFLFGLRFGLRARLNFGWQKGIGFGLVLTMLVTFAAAAYSAYSNGLIRSKAYGGSYR